MTTLSAPPQAYTRETLAQAYVWLKGQPDSIKDRAKNADALVSLYLHACRHGLDVFKENSSETEAPRSSQNFKNTLKNLSEGFRKFEEATVVSMPNNVSHINPSSPRTGTSFNARSELSEDSHQFPSPPEPTERRDQSSRSLPQESPHRESPPSPNQNVSHSVRVQTQDSRNSSTNSGSPREQFPIYRSYIAEDEWAQSGTSVSLEAPFPPFANAANELTLDSRSHEILRRVRRKMNLSSETEALRMLLSLGFERLRDIVP